MSDPQIMICDFTGYPLDTMELHALVDAAVLYLREKKGGLVRFRHAVTEGTIEAHGVVSNGPIHGERFTTEYVWEGKERGVEFVLPPSARRLRIPGDAVHFYKTAPRRTKSGEPIH